MEKILRHSLLRRNQAIKESVRTSKKKVKKQWTEYQQAIVVREQAIRTSVKAERKARREDWICGPLAPRRDVGEQQGIYGTVHQSMLQGPQLPNEVSFRNEERCFAAGDRAVIVRGAEKGKISKIKSISWARNTATLEGLNIADGKMPSFAQAAEATKKYQSVEMPIPLEDLRLVTVMEDLDTGNTRDVVVRHMHGGLPKIEREHGSNLPKHTRYISGVNVPIPWPEDDPTEYEPQDRDMSRLEVDQQITYMPSIYEPPLQTSVEAELLKPHKKNQRRFPIEFMKERIVKDAEEIWRKERKMQTPLDEYHNVRRKEKQERGSPQMDEETRNLIMQMRATHQKRSDPVLSAA